MRAIVSMDLNGAIGNKKELLYRINTDMKFFKQVTTENGTVIVGRKTFDSDLNKKPLPNRVNIVLSKNKTILYDKDGKFNIWNFVDIPFLSVLFPEAIVIGGEAIYELFEPYIDYIYLTEVLDDVRPADTFFPYKLRQKLKSMAKIVFTETIATDRVPAIRMSVNMCKDKYKLELEKINYANIPLEG